MSKEQEQEAVAVTKYDVTLADVIEAWRGADQATLAGIFRDFPILMSGLSVYPIDTIAALLGNRKAMGLEWSLRDALGLKPVRGGDEPDVPGIPDESGVPEASDAPTPDSGRAEEESEKPTPAPARPAGKAARPEPSEEEEDGDIPSRVGRAAPKQPQTGEEEEETPRKPAAKPGKPAAQPEPAQPESAGDSSEDDELRALLGEVQGIEEEE